MNRKILITGVAGFIGSALAKKLIDFGDNVFGVDSINSYYDVKLKNYRIELLNRFSKKLNNFQFKKIDLSDNSEVINLFKKNEFDYVFHFAAQAGVRHSYIFPEEYLHNNVQATFNLMNVLKDIKIKRFYFSSTSSVYGNKDSKKNLNENSILEPIQFYAYTKKWNEENIKLFCENNNLNATIMRFFTVYGPLGRPDMGIYKFVNASLRGEKVDVYNFGNHTRCFTYVDDLVSILFTLLNKDDSNMNKLEIINIANPNKVKLKYLLELIEKKTKKKLKINFLPLQQGDVIGIVPSIVHLRSLVGDFEFTPIDLGIEKYIDWFLSYYDI